MRTILYFQAKTMASNSSPCSEGGWAREENLMVSFSGTQSHAGIALCDHELTPQTSTGTTGLNIKAATRKSLEENTGVSS